MITSFSYELKIKQNGRKQIIWAVSRQDLSSGFLTKRDSNQSTQLQRLARQMKFCMEHARLLCSPDREQERP